MRANDGHVNGITKRLQETDFAEYEQFKQRASESAANAAIGTYKVTTKDGQVYEFTCRADQDERYLTSMASRAIRSWQFIQTIERVS